MKQLFTAQSVQEQVEVNAVAATASSKTERKSAKRTHLNSLIIRKEKVTQTAQLDFVLLASLALAENHTVTLQQVSALADSCSVKLTVSRIAEHIKTNKLASISNSVVTLDPDLIDFYTRSVRSREYKEQLSSYFEQLFALLSVVDSDHDSALSEHVDYQHSIAIDMNAEFDHMKALVIHKKFTAAKTKKAKDAVLKAA